jgi:hypothetical protein
VPSPQKLFLYLPPGKYVSLIPEVLQQNVLPVSSAAVTGLAIAGAEDNRNREMKLADTIEQQSFILLSSVLLENLHSKAAAI